MRDASASFSTFSSFFGTSNGTGVVKRMKIQEPKCFPLPETIKYEWLLPGEDCELEVQDVIFVEYGVGVAHGTLTCTNYQVRFDTYEQQDRIKGRDHLSIPLFAIDKINKIGDFFSSFFAGESEHGFCIELECKDMRIIKFSFVPYSNSRRKALSWLSRNIPPSNRIFANQFFDNSFATNRIYDLYDPIAEYSRLGIKQTNGPWRLSTANKNYELCKTYPNKLLVPSSVTDEILFESSKFRTKGRIPVCCWRHPENGAALCRSSQPRVGIVGNQCNYDQFLILSIQVASVASHPDVERPDITESLADIDEQGPPPLIIFDPRPRVNAVANTVVGAGFESSNTYRNCQVRFLGIANIHSVRDSFIKMRTFCNSVIPLDAIPSSLNATEWYQHLTTIFNGTNEVAKKLRKGVSALVHCSDGWDRTTQIVSLVQILMDPYYRTLEGFIVLIEKEWLSFGHKFADRCRTTIKKGTKVQERSPIFLQFLESVYHLLVCYPPSFQFTEKLLRELVFHVHSCKYGTFLYNSERERKEFLKKRRTIFSFWIYILQNRNIYTNEDYHPDGETKIIFDTSEIRTWPYYPAPKAT